MRTRQFEWDDLPAIVALMNRYGEAIGSTRRVTLEQIERIWRTPYNHPDRDGFVAPEPDGSIIGYTIADLFEEPNFAYGVYEVLPGHSEIARALIQRANDHFMQSALAKSAPHVPITMQWQISKLDTAGITLFELLGMQQVRQFYTMKIALDQPIEPLPLPDEFTLRPFTPDDLQAVYEAKVEIFKDHWGGQHDTFSEWQSDIAQPHFDPSLWWIAYQGSQIAGIVLAEATTPQSGWVSFVGIRREWRKRGLAQILLKLAFAEFQRRGFESVSLGVDSNSQSNAVALYQRVGMHIFKTTLYYDQILRPGASEA